LRRKEPKNEKIKAPNQKGTPDKIGGTTATALSGVKGQDTRKKKKKTVGRKRERTKSASQQGDGGLGTEEKRSRKGQRTERHVPKKKGFGGAGRGETKQGEEWSIRGVERRGSEMEAQTKRVWESGRKHCVYKLSDSRGY